MPDKPYAKFIRICEDTVALFEKATRHWNSVSRTFEQMTEDAKNVGKEKATG